ncbi:MAG: SDR family oxidoreductase [Cytophagales bacterium]|nr:SDR family oxidoreductase [Cytophagales bacterium]
MKKALLLGASSDIAEACANVFAQKGFEIVLAARNAERLQPLAQDLRIKYQTETSLREFDAADPASHASFASSASDADVVLLFFGYLGDHQKALHDSEEAKKIMQINYLSAVSVLSEFANLFEKRGSGAILAVSSVAGERGRQSNYFYGSAKAGLTAFLSGLRNRLHPHVHVATVKPGFVNTKMVEGLPLPAPLTAEPMQAAQSIYDAFRKKKNTVYTLPVWRLIMFVIRSIPEPLFKRMSL